MLSLYLSVSDPHHEVSNGAFLSQHCETLTSKAQCHSFIDIFNMITD